MKAEVVFAGSGPILVLTTYPMLMLGAADYRATGVRHQWAVPESQLLCILKLNPLQGGWVMAFMDRRDLDI